MGDFRNFYKPDQEKLETIASDVVKSAINLYEPIAKKNDIDIDIKLESENKIHIYKNEVIQVLLNILKNAGDNFKEKEINNPKINIKTFDQNDTTAIIEICDNGGGILEDIMPKIFDPYFSTKSAKNGTGLGLYMSKNIIQEHHQGTLEAYNKKGGACFKISLVDFP
jgi:C4-dicarboxylate-specific signal transduction histidine kinase